jgi:hypothetical protein
MGGRAKRKSGGFFSGCANSQVFKKDSKGESGGLLIDHRFPRLIDLELAPATFSLDWAAEYFAKAFDGLVLKDYKEP